MTPNESPSAVRQALDLNGPLPEAGADASVLLNDLPERLFEHSLFNGHPRFWGYITSSASPVGVLGDFLASAVNQNCGSWTLAPMATEIEAQTVRWIAEFIGYPASCGGLLVSGGNMANFVCLLAARTAKAGWDVRKGGLGNGAPRLIAYATGETHTWIHKAADLFGFGTDSIRWIAIDGQQRMDPDDLRRQIAADRARGDQPYLVVGTAGSVSTGSTSTAHTAAWRPRYPGRRTTCVRYPTPTLSRSTRTNGCMRRSKPVARWFDPPNTCATHFRTAPRITTGTTLS